MRTEPLEVMAGWKQAGGGRGKEEGTAKTLKTQNALNNVLPSKLGSGCRQGLVAFFFFW